MSVAARLAAASLVGAVLAGLLHLIAIEIVGVTGDPGSVRLARAGYHVVTSIGFGALLAVVPAVWARWRPARDRVFWLVIAGLAIAGAGGLLATVIVRLTTVTAWRLGLPTEGVPWILVAGAYIVIAGLAIPLAFVVGEQARRWRWTAIAAAALGAAVLLVQPLVGLDDRDDAHALATWIAATGLGALVAPLLPAHVLRSRGVLAVLAACVALTIVWAPSNAVRIALFRDPGAAPAWVLAQLAWPPLSDDGQGEQALAAAPAAVSSPRVAAPVVVLVTIDAMRGDVLASRRHDKLLPNLAALRDGGTYFSQAVAPSAQTAVSLTSLFTGRYFSSLLWTSHGAGFYRSTYAVTDPSPRFPALLTAAGVRTASVLSPRFLADAYGIARGFAREVVLGRDHAYGASSAVAMLRELAEIRDGEPAFLYAHLMDAHEPYTRGSVREGPAYERYISELATVDRQIGRLREVLAARFPERGFLVIAADHGEAFGEHGRMFHSGTLYDEMIAVPLLVWGPTVAAQVRRERVSLVDIAPTILALFGVASADFEGRDLLARAIPPRPVAAETRLKRAVYTLDGLKVIEDLRRKTVEVYDLARDPGERDNLWSRESARARRALATARAFFRARANPTPGYTPPFRR